MWSQTSQRVIEIILHWSPNPEMLAKGIPRYAETSNGESQLSYFIKYSIHVWYSHDPFWSNWSFCHVLLREFQSLPNWRWLSDPCPVQENAFLWAAMESTLQPLCQSGLEVSRGWHREGRQGHSGRLWLGDADALRWCQREPHDGGVSWEICSWLDGGTIYWHMQCSWWGYAYMSDPYPSITIISTQFKYIYCFGKFYLTSNPVFFMIVNFNYFMNDYICTKTVSHYVFASRIRWVFQLLSQK